MATEKRNGEGNGYERRQAEPGAWNDCLNGLMDCYNMPAMTPDDCAEAEARTADRSHAEALMRYYNG